MFPRSLLGQLFPDEPVWSGLARLKYRYPHLTRPDYVRAGAYEATELDVAFIFPRNARALADMFGFKDSYEEFLMRHTYWPWLKEDHRNKPITLESLRKGRLRCRKENNPVFKMRGQLVERMRACYCCMEADIEEFGVPYWHRLHQFKHKNCPRDGFDLWTSDVPRPTRSFFHYTALTVETEFPEDQDYPNVNVFPSPFWKFEKERAVLYHSCFSQVYPIHIVNRPF
jgi:hypothetical protein